MFSLLGRRSFERLPSVLCEAQESESFAASLCESAVDRVGLIEKWGGVEAGMQKEAMKRDPEKLIQLKAFQESQLRNARKSLSGS
ncbi:hypothetical protein AB0G29_06630 [Streptomyces parvus]|uniref:hypothetical protein n=1 Tax=Streptomyces parvus TaxID=66428 RepID=UPI003408EE06